MESSVGLLAAWDVGLRAPLHNASYRNLAWLSLGCSVVGHYSPLEVDTTELKEGDVVKMYAPSSNPFPSHLVLRICSSPPDVR